MKRLILDTCLFILLMLFGVNSAFAHDENQPHFFKINDNYIEHYPISSTSLPDFILPREIDLTPHVVNEQISFEIERQSIPLSNKQIDPNSFLLDFGDGKKESGVKFTHTYMLPGTYFIIITVKPPFSVNTIIDTAFINVVPSKDYKLPKAIIKVNNNQQSGEIGVKLANPVSLDGSESFALNKITNYFWDLGDGKSSDHANVIHTYENYHFGANVLLRVKDNMGLISDTQIRLIDEDKVDTPRDTSTKGNLSFAAAIIGVFIILFVVYRYKKKLYKHKDKIAH